jgi:hypothetical protein
MTQILAPIPNPRWACGCSPPRHGNHLHPYTDITDYGTLWQCDECGRYWSCGTIDGTFGAWEQIGARKARRIIKRRNKVTS